ncbi:PREDICTED: olfactory receptor 10AG1-like [Elephantulus edwardii]|uniref:olfactory receptor 10AG1-like n=1 Tax=Elephantulus edwardii TaxID=28737 RepID=UPI0003F0ECFA|nr:PREDICTED: olfactory receptor 10AG1-like [Elephantulus edwardii]
MVVLRLRFSSITIRPTFQRILRGNNIKGRKQSTFSSGGFKPGTFPLEAQDSIVWKVVFFDHLNALILPLIYGRGKEIQTGKEKCNVNLSFPQMNPQEMLTEGNLTKLKEFVLLDFAELPHLQWFLFGLFLIIYIIILTSNGTICLLTKIDPALQSPMYFFLANFSFLEICYVSVTLPRMLKNFATQRRRISLVACATQMYFFFVLGSAECLLLAVMAYDRYVAICNPLHYPLVMNRGVCIQLVTGSWITAVPVQIGQTYEIFTLHFCGSNQINHFFCDIPPILKLSCGDIFVNEMLEFIGVTLYAVVPFLLILGSYSKIISTILKLPSATSRAKAFSTCSSHLMAVGLFFGTAIISYLRPKTSHPEGTDKVLSLFYTILTPMFNPMIYTLRNKDVIMALRKLLCK